MLRDVQAHLVPLSELFEDLDRLRQVGVRANRGEVMVVAECERQTRLVQRASLVVPVAGHEIDAPAAQGVRERFRQIEHGCGLERVLEVRRGTLALAL